jgi:hypothetical protein
MWPPQNVYCRASGTFWGHPVDHGNAPDSSPIDAGIHAAAREPYPPRRWWLKRIAVASGLFTAAFITLFAAWHYYADQRLQAAIDKIKAAGEPLFPADFNTPPIPDEDNAVVLLEQAGEMILANEELLSLRLDGCFAFVGSDDEFISSCGILVENYAEALDLVRQARKRPQARWPTKAQSPLLHFEICNLAAQRSIAKLLAIRIRWLVLHSQHAEAARSIGDILTVAAVVDQHVSLLGHLVALSIEEYALRTIENNGGGLANSDTLPREHLEMSLQDEMRHLIRQLLSEDRLKARFLYALQFERALQFDILQEVIRMKVSLNGLAIDESSSWKYRWPLTHLLTEPPLQIIAAELIDYSIQCLPASQASTYPEHDAMHAAVRKPTRLARPEDSALRIQGSMASIVAPSFDRANLLHYHLLSRRRMAATALAIRLFELDHGHRPQTLNELVPEYLPSVPADPMSSNGVIQYLPNAEHPRLYSIGPDGIDDGGEYVYKSEGRINYDVADIPFFLDGQPPPPGEASEAAPVKP